VERRRLGTSDLAITSVGLGTWAIGGSDWIFGWGPQKDSESLAAIKRAVEAGINWIDTAAAYGLGHAEMTIARALREVSRRDRPYVFTHCGLVWDELGNVSQSLKPESIRREAEASLRRLDVDCLDLYQLGWPASPNCPSIDDAGSFEEAWATMAALQREGKARFIGVSNCDVEKLDRLRRIAPVTSLQAPYSLIRRELEDRTLPFCERHQIGVIAHSSIHSGLLTGRMTPERIDALPHNDWRRRSPLFQEPMRSRALALVECLREVAAHDARTPGQVAIAWALHPPAVTAASVGLRLAQQVTEAVEAASVRLSAKDIDDLEHASHRVRKVSRDRSGSARCS
jgi:aryl-alcohol dehydrogenase-like predicted oxidoreductase